MGRVLLAEDDRDMRRMLATMLEMAGHVVVAVEDGQKALDLILSSRGDVPDAIVSDLRMPKIDGLEFLRRLRAVPRFHDIPFLLLTAVPQDGRVDHVARAPRTKVRGKPISSLELRRALDEMLALS